MKKYKKTYTIAIILIVGIIVFSTIAFSVNQYLLPLLPIKYQNRLFFFSAEVGVTVALFAGIAQITGYSMRDLSFNKKKERSKESETENKKIWFSPNDHLSNDKVEKNKTLSLKPSIGIESKSNDYGITIDNSGEYTISIDPIDHFSYRIGKAFPGVRNLQWFDKPQEAIDRLELLLKPPLVFKVARGHNTNPEPIWWFHGDGCSSIRKFKRLNKKKCLMNREELEINKIAIYVSPYNIWQYFVYVEVKGEKSTGLYPSNQASVNEFTLKYGYYYEEYGLYKGIPITRSSYEDGAAVIDGKVVDVSEAEARTRYLTPYNFFITSAYSPIGNPTADPVIGKTLNGLLRNQTTFNNAVDIILRLPKRYIPS